jgi:hypothetical protein
MTEKYRPSNGSEGMDFMSRFCDVCKKDNPDKMILCPIIAATFAFNVDDPMYPKEWIYDEGKPICTAFEDENKEQIEPRCKHTLELFPKLVKPNPKLIED